LSFHSIKKFLNLYMDDKEKIMYFKNDDEFYEFCVMPKIIFRTEINPTTNKEYYVADWDFTQAYKNAIADGMYFMIKDENSSIFKHGAVTYRVATKPIKNLLQYINVKNPKLKKINEIIV